jgi:hypothetical protein
LRLLPCQTFECYQCQPGMQQITHFAQCPLNIFPRRSRCQ